MDDLSVDTSTRSEDHEDFDVSNNGLTSPAIGCLVIGSLLVAVVITVTVLFIMYSRKKVWSDHSITTSLETANTKTSTHSYLKDGPISQI